MEPIDWICAKCKHLRPLSGGCDAFPDGIPDEIMSGENRHSKPLEHQTNDVVFEKGENELEKRLTLREK